MFTKQIFPDCYKVMGARLDDHGAHFRVWAPNAKAVFLIGSFNDWNATAHPMVKNEESIWEISISGLGEGESYRFSIEKEDGTRIEKVDPFAVYFESGGGGASLTARFDQYTWGDAEWFASPKTEAIYIYELHLGAWKAGLNYREIAGELIPYVKEMGYTHVELMPVTEHPLDESWGYQVSGYYAITSRFGTIEDFQAMVDLLHQAGIGVILDWVPGHFPKDHFALAQFDGTPLFEYSDPQLGYQPTWDTLVFDYRSVRVRNFLLGSALYFLEVMHIDAIRVDAVYSMLKLDFGRKNWKANKKGGSENLEAIEFLQIFNQILHERVPKVLTIAEESGSFPGVTKPIESGGLGFDYKWNMGFTHDFLELMSTKPEHRTHRHGLLDLIASYAFLEKHILPLSHDEACLFEQMPGEPIQKWANMRLLLGYFFCFPGKKLTFMGNEIGQTSTWSVKESVPFDLLDKTDHDRFHLYVKTLGHFYRSQKDLWGECYEKVASDPEKGLFAFWRGSLLCAFVFKTEALKLEIEGNFKVLFDSGATEFGGFGIVGDNSKQLAPLSMRIMRHE